MGDDISGWWKDSDSESEESFWMSVVKGGTCSTPVECDILKDDNETLWKGLESLLIRFFVSLLEFEVCFMLTFPISRGQ